MSISPRLAAGAFAFIPPPPHTHTHCSAWKYSLSDVALPRLMILRYGLATCFFLTCSQALPGSSGTVILWVTAWPFGTVDKQHCVAGTNCRSLVSRLCELHGWASCCALQPVEVFRLALLCVSTRSSMFLGPVL